MKLSLYYSKLLKGRHFLLIAGRMSLVAGFSFLAVSILLLVSTPSTAFVATEFKSIVILFVLIGFCLGFVSAINLGTDFSQVHSDYLKCVGASRLQECCIQLSYSAPLFLSGVPVTLWVAYNVSQPLLVLCYAVSFFFSFLFILFVANRIEQFAETVHMPLAALSLPWTTRFQATINQKVLTIKKSSILALIVIVVGTSMLEVLLPSPFWLVPSLVLSFFGILFDGVASEEGVLARDTRQYYHVGLSELRIALIVVSATLSVIVLFVLFVLCLIIRGAAFVFLPVGVITLAVSIFAAFPILDYMLKNIDQEGGIAIEKWMLTLFLVFFALVPAALYGVVRVMRDVLSRKRSNAMR